MSSSSARRRMVGAIITAILACLIAAPSAALAAPARVQTLVTSVDDGGPGVEGVLVVSAELAKGTKLPTSVDIPVPRGAKLTWVGEILGGDVSGDPEAKYTVKPGKDGDILTVSLTKSLTGQAEAAVPALAGTADGRRSTSATLPIPYAVGEAVIVLRAPADAKSLKYSAGLSPSEGPKGFSYFTLRRTAPKPGTSLSATVSYTGGTFPAGGGPAGGSPEATPGSGATAGGADGMVGLWVIGGVIAVVAIIAVMRRRRPGDTAADEEDLETPDAADPAEEPAPASSAKEPAASGSAPPVVTPKSILFGLVVVLIAGAVWMSVSANKPPVKGGVLTQQAGVQRLTVDTSSGDFVPGDFKVKVGVPVELEFGPGKGCTARITFPSLNVDQDLTQGAVVRLPALKAGTYSYNCGSGSPSGTLIAE